MAELRRFDATKFSCDIFSDFSMKPREFCPGPPVRKDSVNVGIITMTENAPHDGEVHPDGDEFLYVISGRLRVSGDNLGDMELGPGEGCIVPQGEWHKVDVLEVTQLIYMTPGPNGDHRPLPDAE